MIDGKALEWIMTTDHHHCLDMNISLIQAIGERNPQKILGSIWDLNPGPSECQPDALATEPLDPQQRNRDQVTYSSTGQRTWPIPADLLSHSWLPACDMVEISCGWSYGPGWINCTSTLPERILSLSTTSASGSIISHLEGPGFESQIFLRISFSLL